jgi:hypothetical protein
MFGRCPHQAGPDGLALNFLNSKEMTLLLIIFPDEVNDSFDKIVLNIAHFFNDKFHAIKVFLRNSTQFTFLCLSLKLRQDLFCQIEIKFCQVSPPYSLFPIFNTKIEFQAARSLRSIFIFGGATP